jgi:hypothetical protein
LQDPILKTKYKQKCWGYNSSSRALEQEALDSIPSTAKRKDIEREREREIMGYL